MTAEDHNKVLGICHLIYGGMHLIGTFFIGIWFLFVMGVMGASASRGGANAAAPIAIIGVIAVVFGFFMLLLTLPPLLAGYNLLKRKQSARMFGIIAACVEALSFPMGTALCVYTFWFLMGDMGKQFYDRSNPNWWAERPALSPEPANADWANTARRGSERDYVPPTQPPNWR